MRDLLALCSGGVVAALLLVSPAHAGGLGALCDANSPCDDGLTCRDGFCLRLESAPEPAPEAPRVEEPKAVEPPKVEEPKPVEEPKVEPPKVEEPKPVEEPKAEPPKVEEPKPVEEPKIEDSKIEDSKIEDSKIEDSNIEGSNIEQPEIDEPQVDEPESAPQPGAALKGKSPAERVTLAEDAGGQVWGAAGARAVATPALVCGGCLAGAGACTALGGWQFVSDADRGRFDDDTFSNRNARIGGFIGLAVGSVATLFGVPLLLVGEGASLYGAFLDVSLCGSGLGLEDGFLMALGGGHGVAWTLAPQLLGIGAALAGGGAWVWVAANGVNSYPETDSGARAILYGYQNAALGMMAASTLPLGLGCLLGLAGIGVDFGSVLRAGALRDEALEEEAGLDASLPRSSDLAGGPRVATTLGDGAIAY